MAWYWIVLIAIGYFVVMGACLGVLLVVEDKDETDFMDVFLCVLWPVAIPCSIVALIPVGIAFLIKDKLIYKRKRR